VRSPCAVPVSRAFVCWVLRLPFGFVSFGGGVGVVVFWFCLRLFAIPFVLVDGPVARWLRHRHTEPGISASSPAGVIVAWLRGFYWRGVEQTVGSLSSVVRAMVL
jgi:hypothetical protein